MKLKRPLYVAGLSLGLMLAIGATLAGNASAAPLWLLCLEGSGLTKYSNNRCAEASATGAWQSSGLPSGRVETVKLIGFTLRLGESGPGSVAIKCDKGVKGWGLAEGPSKLIISTFMIEELEHNCEGLEGCEKSGAEKFEGGYLPWKTEILEEGGKYLSQILSYEALTERPLYEITCRTILGPKTAKCHIPEEERLELVSEKSGGVLLVRSRFEEKSTTGCKISGSFAVLLATGASFSIHAS